MSIIRLNNITKKYNSKTILHSIFFKLDKSQKVGLIGINGSGKTTLFKLILGSKIQDLSGGQQARVALAQCLLSGCNTIILDEPTNHLDITSIQSIECALVNFPGTVIFVSHDTFFIDKTATRILVYKDGTFENYAGTISMYNAKV